MGRRMGLNSGEISLHDMTSMRIEEVSDGFFSIGKDQIQRASVQTGSGGR